MTIQPDAAGNAAQAYRDGFDELWKYVQTHGVRRTAEAIWYPGHRLTVGEIEARLEEMQARARKETQERARTRRNPAA